MTFTFVNNATSTEALAATMSATWSTAPVSGMLMTAQMFTKSDTTPTNPTGWNTDIEVFNATNSDYLRICSKIAGAGETSTVTFTNLANDRGSLGIYQLTPQGTPSLDKTSSSAFATGVTSKSSGQTLTTAQGDEIAIVAFGIRNVNISGASLNNSFTLKNFTIDGSVASLIDGFKIETVTTTETATASWTTAADPMGAIATYKDVISGGSASRIEFPWAGDGAGGVFLNARIH